MSKNRVIEGFEFRFERRRYGRQFYTWAYVKAPDGQWLMLGDPWPCSVPKRSELVEAARVWLEKYARGEVRRD